jgi:hypothetical protein
MVHKEEEIFYGHGGQLRSGFGKQTLGRAHTAPDFGFGSSTRDATLKLYASADHDRAKVKSSGGNQSQGAIYKVIVRARAFTCTWCVPSSAIA